MDNSGSHLHDLPVLAGHADYREIVMATEMLVNGIAVLLFAWFVVWLIIVLKEGSY
jgi:hypothetical protein